LDASKQFDVEPNTSHVFIQFGFLGLSTYLYTAPQALDQLNISFLAKYAALLCAITTFGLWIVMLIDKKLRDIHRINIESYDLGVHPASVWQKPFENDKSAHYVDLVFHAGIFLVFISIDMYASYKFGLPLDKLVTKLFCH